MLIVANEHLAYTLQVDSGGTKVWIFGALLVCSCGAPPPIEKEGHSEVLVSVDFERASFLPLPIRPVKDTLYLDSNFEGVLQALREKDWRGSAILLHWLRQKHPASEEATALHWWALCQGDSPQDAVDRSENHPVSEESCGAFARGSALFLTNESSAALDAFLLVLKSHPKDSQTIFLAATCAVEAGRGLVAARLMDQFVLVDSLDFDSSMMRARALSLAERWEEAFLQYDEILKEQAEDAEIWIQAGLVAFRHGVRADLEPSFERAASCFAKACTLEPQNGRAWFNLGCALQWGKDPTGAEDAYRRALELRPGHLGVIGNMVELLRNQERFGEARRLLTSQLRQPLASQDEKRIRAWLLGIPENL